MDEKLEIEQESSGILAYLTHPFKVITSLPKNLKKARTEVAKIKSLENELNNTASGEIKKVNRWGIINGFFAALAPIAVAAVSRLPIPAAIGSFLATRSMSEAIQNRYQRMRNVGSKRIRLKKEKELARVYLNSAGSNAETYKNIAPKVGNSLEQYVKLSASTRSATVQLISNAAILTIVNPVSAGIIAVMSLYNVALRLYDLNAMKKNQQKEISTKNTFHQTINNLVDAASIIRETNRADYANSRLNASLTDSVQAVEESEKKKEILNNKKIPFFSISSAIMWGASIWAGTKTGIAVGTAAGTAGGVATGIAVGAMAGAAIFAAALMASDVVARASNDLVRLHSEKVEVFREYEKNMQELSNNKNKIRTGEKTLDTSRGHLQMKNVNFTYDTGRGIQDVSLDFQKGQINVITGESGSGKSTVFSLLKHDLEAQSGTVSIDGVDIQKLTQESINNQISFIAQRPVFLKASIAEEMRLFNQNATDDEMQQALLSVGLEGLPLNASTYTEDEKPALSGGQMQRLVIARALLKKSPILLMDEPTANLDASSKQEVWDVIERLKKDKTIVLVSHDAFEIMNADNISLLEKGRLATQGSPDELKDHPYFKEVQKRAKNAVKKEVIDPLLKDYLKTIEMEEKNGVLTPIPDLFALAAAKRTNEKK